MSTLSKLKHKIVLASVVTFSSVSAFAAETTGSNDVDFSQLTNSINFGNVMVGILAVAGALIGIYAGMAGVKWVLRMVRGA
ncbi:major capsid protein [Providencia rettgeri]